MQIALILNGRYPTDKAYGVTTEATAQILLQQNVKLTIYAFRDSNSTKSENKTLQIKYFTEDKMSELLRIKINKGNNYTNKLAWAFYIKMYQKWLLKELENDKPDLLWYRDYSNLRITQKTKISSIFEVHQTIRRRKIYKLERIKSKLVLAPISKFLLTNVNTVHHKKIFAPMGINQNNIVNRQDISKYVNRLIDSEEITITYVGRLFPGGKSKGVDTIVKIAKEFKNSQLIKKFDIVGGDYKELAKFKNIVCKENVESKFNLLGQLIHKRAIEHLLKSDIVILTRPDDPNYRGFPLKSLEAVAAGKIVLVEDCEVFRDIFSHNVFLIWFKPNHLKSVEKRIARAINDPEIIEKLAKNVEFASQFTWEKRTLQMLNSTID